MSFLEGAPESIADEVYVFIVGKGAKGKVKRMIHKNLDKIFGPVLRKVAVNIGTSRWLYKFKLIVGHRAEVSFNYPWVS